MRAWRSARTFALLILALPAPAGAGEDARLAWLRDGRTEVRRLADALRPAERAPAQLAAPLGSLWKLFVFAYLEERGVAEPAYACRVERASADGEERACCEWGERVTRAAALARSCAPYFEPARLGISREAWRRHWQARGVASWLVDLERLRPATEVKVKELLAALAAISPQARASARSALLETALAGYGREAWSALGTGLRYKTYTWHRADEPGVTYGGAAGWLPDGTPFWFGARGSSRTALAAWASRITAALPPIRWREAAREAASGACVEVEFFSRYPLRAVWRERDAVRASPGVLEGRYRLEFANGNRLRIASAGELQMSASIPPALNARLPLNEYVARVVEREGGAAETEAARALAVAARSYLVQNARQDAGCWRIADSSRTQRVSANPPGPAALGAAWFTDDLALQGMPVRYHRDAPGDHRLAWRDARARAAEGWSFERILAEAYPRATLAALSGIEDCARIAEAESWLARSAPAWRRRLQGEPGYEPPAGPLRVCTLAEGHPYSDARRMRIYVRGWRSLDERATLAHEYVHLAFRFHPRGADEAYVERLARRLIEG